MNTSNTKPGLRLALTPLNPWSSEVVLFFGGAWNLEEQLVVSCVWCFFLSNGKTGTLGNLPTSHAEEETVFYHLPSHLTKAEPSINKRSQDKVKKRNLDSHGLVPPTILEKFHIVSLFNGALHIQSDCRRGSMSQ